MKTILFAAAAISLAALGPASAQMPGAGAPGMAQRSNMSCVSGGQFVPCPMSGMLEPGSGMGPGTGPGTGPGMGPRDMMPDGRMAPRRRMTRAEKRRMMREQGM